MNTFINSTDPFEDQIAIREQTRKNFAANWNQICCETDRMFAVLMALQWLAAVVAVLVISPKTWIGQSSFIHIHIWAAVFLGGLISVVPIILALTQTGKPITRYTIAVGQILMSVLLIHVTGGRIETHFHIFGSLAFLSFYRDWRVLVPATVLVLIDHLFRGIYYPQSVFGVLTASHWRWIEHGGWVFFIDIFLFLSCIRNMKEMWQHAYRTAKLDASEEKYRSVIENAGDIIFRMDQDGKFIFVNQTFSNTLGYDLERDRDLLYTDLIPETFQTKVRRFYQKQLLEGTPTSYHEFPVRKHDGTQIWIGQNVQLVYKGGKFEGFQAVVRDITTRVKAEQALKDSEARYRTVTDSASDAIITIDTRNVILFANEACRKVFGYQAEELVGQNLSILIPPRLQEAHLEGMKRFLKTRKKSIAWHSVEVPALHRDGNEFLVEISFGEYNSDGNKIFTAIIRDITERKRVQEAIRKSEEYQNLFKLANDSIIIFEPESQEILDVNDQACKKYGYPREEFIGMKMGQISGNPENTEDAPSDLLSPRTPGAFEAVHFKKDKTPINLLVNYSLIEFQEKEAVLSINRDISSMVRANRALRESEYKFRTLIESMNEGVLELDRESNILFVNEYFCRMVGYSRSELVGKNASLLLFDEENRRIFRKKGERLLKGFSEKYEVKIKTKFGETIWSLVGATPIFENEGRITGSMSVHTDITERKQSEQKLLYTALHDALTGLPNRIFLKEHLQQATNRETRNESPEFALLFLDFDRFKVINDSLGHLEGDNLLIKFARRLESCVRPGDIIARLGGDEFTVLVEKISGIEDVLAVVERIQNSLKDPFILNDRKIYITTSIGIALSSSSYRKAEEILRDADIAMYRAKESGKGRYEVFSEDMHEKADRRLQLETEMRLALERREFRVHYQPIVELGTRRIIGFEALLRWVHPVRGMVSPADFIPIAEENEMIIEIGDWVLAESCRQMREWHLSNPDYAELSISVNLSCKQFRRENLAERVSEILSETGLDPRHLKLEVTESHLMENIENAIQIMQRLRDLGVQLSIDDFGTGYSSLSYLHHLPINYLKVDRSFVGRMHLGRENSEIVRTIVMLAKILDFEVIAEGVETEQQAGLLRELQCSFGQGYLFSKPLENTRVPDFLCEQIPLKKPEENAALDLPLVG
ncbi:MAG: PAS domain S-box protein [Pyrinomonadaceae bacterium]